MINLFDKAVAKYFLTAYRKEVVCAVSDSKIDLRKCNISLIALRTVCREAQKDCEIFQERRPPGHVVSDGKLPVPLFFGFAEPKPYFLMRLLSKIQQFYKFLWMRPLHSVWIWLV